MLITSLDFSSFTGRIAIGRLQRGKLSTGMNVSLVKRDKSIVKLLLELRAFYSNHVSLLFPNSDQSYE